MSSSSCFGGYCTAGVVGVVGEDTGVGYEVVVIKADFEVVDFCFFVSDLNTSNHD